MSSSSVAEGTTTFRVDDYTVVASLNPESIYVKVTHRTACVCYEASVDQTDLRLPFDLRHVYEFVSGCFSKKEGHTVDFAMSPGILKVRMHAVVGGYLPIETELVLREQERSEEGNLSVTLVRMEQRVAELEKQNQELKEGNERMGQLVTELVTQNQETRERMKQSVTETEQRLVGLEECGVVLIFPRWEGMNSHAKEFYKLNTTEIVANVFSQFGEIESWTRLKKMRIHDAHGADLPPGFSSATLECLILDHGPISSLTSINKLPNLKRLELRSCAHIMTPFVDILKTYPHKIEDITVHACHPNFYERLPPYCLKNNIRLTISS